MGHIFGYIREPVGSDSGLPSLAEQRATLEAFARLVGVSIAACFEDRASAASLPFLKRPGAKRLWRTIRPGDGVLVPAGPFWISTIADAAQILARLQTRQVTFAAVEKDRVLFRNDDEIGQLTTQVLIAAAKARRTVEWEVRSNGTKAGKAKAKAAGRLHVNPARINFGYMVVKDPDDGGRVVPNPEERQTLARIAQLRREGRTWQAIADELNADGITTRGGKPLLKQHVCSMHKAALSLEEGLSGAQAANRRPER
jgi:site-specific DNA recombinase